MAQAQTGGAAILRRERGRTHRKVACGDSHAAADCSIKGAYQWEVRPEGRSLLQNRLAPRQEADAGLSARRTAQVLHGPRGPTADRSDCQSASSHVRLPSVRFALFVPGPGDSVGSSVQDGLAHRLIPSPGDPRCSQRRCVFARVRHAVGADAASMSASSPTCLLLKRVTAWYLELSANTCPGLQDRLAPCRTPCA